MSSKPTLSHKTVQHFVMDKFPDAQKLSSLRGGMESQTFTFTQADRKYILRLNTADAGFHKDAFCQKHFGQTLPIPEIINIGIFDTDHTYCLSAFIDSETAQDLTAEALIPIVPLIQDLQLSIAKTDTSPLSGFGCFNSVGIAPYKSWHHYLHAIVDPIIWDHDPKKLSADQREILDQAIKIYQNLIPSCPNISALYHGDFGANNLLVRHKKVVGVIDWDCAGIGDPLVDIANTYFWATHLKCMQAQAEYAQATLAHLPDFHDRITCYQLKIGLEGVLEDLHENASPKNLAADVTRLAAVLTRNQ